jgi:hypothetical protein
LTFSDSSWQDDWDKGRSTEGYLIYYMGGILDHSNNLPGPVALSSAASEYNEDCLQCQSTSRLHITLNELEYITTKFKEDKPIDILLDNKSVVDMG